MKKTFQLIGLTFVSVVLSCGLAACDEISDNSSKVESTPATPIRVTESGTISTDYEPGQTAKVSFDRFPVNYEDWARLQPTLGKSLAGTVALEMMAMQLYYYNQSEGEKALKANNTDVDASGLIRILAQKFKKSMATASEKDPYFCPFLVASYLTGASPENAYHPNKPYEIVVRMSPEPSHKPQEGTFGFTGINYYLQIYCNGADMAWRGVEVAELKDEPYFKVFNSGGLPSSPKQIAYKSNPANFDEIH